MSEHVGITLAAALVGLSERQFRRLVARGDIAPVGRDGVQQRFARRDVMALRDSRDSRNAATRALA